MFLVKVGFLMSEPMSLYCEIKAAISIAHNPVQHDRMKHVKVNHYIIKDHLKKGNICIPFIQIEDQLVHVFKKGLCRARFMFLIGKLRMVDILFTSLEASVRDDTYM